MTLKHTFKYSPERISPTIEEEAKFQSCILSFLLFFHWKAIYKNVYKGLHKRTENNWNSRSSHLGVFCKKIVLRNFAKFAGKQQLRQSFFFNKVAVLKYVALLKKRLWHRSFPADFAKFLRTHFLVEHLHWLLLRPFLGCK